MTPDVESLRCFCAGAEHLNFRISARAVHLSPAAFGDRIKRLENELDCVLFERTTRRVRLTPAGERLLPQAKRALTEVERCREAAQASQLVNYDLMIGTRFELGLSWLTPALSGLEKRRPERRLNLFFGNTPALLDGLRRDNIDCVITSARLTTARLRYARLHEERYVFVASKKLIAQRPLSQAEHARSHTLLELNGSLPLFRYFLDTHTGSKTWAFQHTQFLGTIGPVRARVLEGAGVAVLPEYFVKRDLKQGRLMKVMPRVKLPSDWFRMIWRSGHPREDDLQQLAEELRSVPLK